MSRANEEEMQARLAKNLWWLRTQRGLTQEALGFRAEIHRTQIALMVSLDTLQEGTFWSTPPSPPKDAK